MDPKDRQALDVINRINEVLETMPGAASILDDIQMGRLAPDEAMDSLMRLFVSSGKLETLVQASSQLTDLYNVTTTPGEDDVPIVMKHDNGMSVVNPIMEAVVKERASLDGDVPEARLGPIPEGGRPAVPVKTDSYDPVIVGIQLRKASEDVAQEIRVAIAEHDEYCTAVLSDVEKNTDDAVRETALEMAKKHLPPVPVGVKGYKAGGKPAFRKGALVPPVAAAELSLTERREHAYRALATTQGRASLSPVIEKGVIDYLRQHGIYARAGEPHPDSSVLSRWTSVVWGADDLSDGFNYITTAIHYMSVEVMDFVSSHPEVFVRVSPHHGIADRRFGWVLVAGPKERS